MKSRKKSRTQQNGWQGAYGWVRSRRIGLGEEGVGGGGSVLSFNVLERVCERVDVVKINLGVSPASLGRQEGAAVAELEKSSQWRVDAFPK